MNNTFCPKCGQPIASSDSEDCLCAICGWFGDCSETTPEQPRQASRVAHVAAALDQYRRMCRNELLAECMAQANADATGLPLIHRFMAQARQSLMEIFVSHRTGDST
jgi:hypothetical protein